MAVPTVPAVGTAAAANGGDINPTLGTHQAGDILLVQIMQKDNVQVSMGAGWAEARRYNLNSTHTESLWWLRAASAAEAAAITHTGGNSIIANSAVVRGAVASGSPFDWFGANDNASADDEYNIEDVDPTVNDTLVVCCVGVGNDVIPSNFAGGGLTWAVLFGDSTSLGTDSAVGMGAAGYPGAHAPFNPITWDDTAGNTVLAFAFAITPAADVTYQPRYGFVHHNNPGIL